MMSARLISVCVLLFTSFANAQGAQSLSALEREAALTAIKAKIQERYVFSELRAKIIEHLDRAQQAGRYGVADPAEFAERITHDLQEITHDKHLWLKLDPAGYAAASQPPDSSDGEEAYWRRKSIRQNHGLTETKILPGNVRYLKIAEFAWVRDESGAVYDSAMCFLKDGDAMIIDVRGNPGGWHFAVQYLVSHFLDADTLELTFLSGAETPIQSRALANLPAGRLKGKPLYVLIDGNMGSASEAFAYDVEQFKLGELIGTKTSGAANTNELHPIAPMFILSVSFGRPVHPISNTNWEGAGVSPTVQAQPASTLDTAHALALTRLSQAPNATPETLAEYAWARVGIDARLKPPSLSPQRLKALAGGYGDIDIAFRDNTLWLTRPNRPVARLLPLTSDGLFALEGSETVRARLTGKAVELLRVDAATPRVFPRD